MDFCQNNDLQLIIRAHECVMDGFERFAQGHLITLFSATNYCGKTCFNLKLPMLFNCSFFLMNIDCRKCFHSGTANNAGAILVLGRDLIVVPKLIHPLPPTVISRDTSPDNHAEDTWMQVKIWDKCK